MRRLILSGIAACALAACAGNDVIDSWRGVPADALLLSWGPPNQESRLSSGGRVISYTSATNRFAAQPDCAVTFQTNGEDIITGATRTEENIGSCSVMLLRKMKAYD